ncbi:unnamed protein product [Candidula unifasciata]|uniref:Uncharacterized protein n=1 Tax=Candidula unifasciata TaxID=100452 RepID=A0A8S3ZDE5_9EUPU|nr:unnamed protein product [Candidula unifasciata]
MSSNFSIENNSPPWEQPPTEAPYIYKNRLRNLLIVNITFAVAGTLINVWFLAAMLLSHEIRSRMRNKIIVGVLVVNLTETVILCGFRSVVSVALMLEAYHLSHCIIYSVYESIYRIEDFVGNWYIVILLCVFASQAMQFKPRLDQRWKNILTAVIFISPCLFAVFFVPLTMYGYDFFYRSYNSMCMTSSLEALKVFEIVGTIVPHTLTVLILVITAVLKRLRYQHTDDRSQMDPWYPFLAVLVTAVVSDVSYTVFFMIPNPMDGLRSTTIEELFLAISIFTLLRVIIMPLVLLLFPDIRERIKVWRPCRQSAPPSDPKSSAHPEITMTGLLARES